MVIITVIIIVVWLCYSWCLVFGSDPESLLKVQEHLGDLGDQYGSFHMQIIYSSSLNYLPSHSDSFELISMSLKLILIRVLHHLTLTSSHSPFVWVNILDYSYFDNLRCCFYVWKCFSPGYPHSESIHFTLQLVNPMPQPHARVGILGTEAFWGSYQPSEKVLK